MWYSTTYLHGNCVVISVVQDMKWNKGLHIQVSAGDLGVFCTHYQFLGKCPHSYYI